MIITAPSIRLRAPVLAGIDDAQLDVGVGHLPGSSWPDLGGTSVLEAHDVTFFARLAALKPGETVEVTAPCRQWIYRVASGRVVRKGTPIVDTPAPTLVLVTCWPTNALYLTNSRYVLIAELTATTNTDSSTIERIAPTIVPTALVPPGVTIRDVTTDAVGVPEGTLTVTGSMDPAASASPRALAAINNAFAVFDVGLIAAEHGDGAWWMTATSPAHPVALFAALPLRGVRPLWREPVNLTLTGAGSTIRAADLTGIVEVRRRLYRLDVHLDDVDGRFAISRWQLTPP